MILFMKTLVTVVSKYNKNTANKCGFKCKNDLYITYICVYYT